jgi:hypothetical protein
MTTNQSRGVHLVGSVPLADAEQVFRTVSALLGERVKRIPDGETGVRTNWIGWQYHVFARNPAFEIVLPDPQAVGYAANPRFKLRPGVSAADLSFDRLGYADAALASYATFARLQQAGDIPAATRFMVSLPTPLAPVVGFVDPPDRAAVEPAYTTQLMAELDAICAAIPHDELAIQWDVAVEFGILEGVWPPPFPDLQAGIVSRLMDAGQRVPDAVELGYHLCYGDAGHRHFAEPKDTQPMVEVANAVAAGLTRPLQWLHLPVPRDRTDDAYYAPLRALRLHPQTELYLGLVHLTDGVEGTRRRIDAARRVVPEFGVATECGLGRRPAATIPDLLRMHAEVTAP